MPLTLVSSGRQMVLCITTLPLDQYSSDVGCDVLPERAHVGKLEYVMKSVTLICRRGRHLLKRSEIGPAQAENRKSPMEGRGLPERTASSIALLDALHVRVGHMRTAPFSPRAVWKHALSPLPESRRNEIAWSLGSTEPPPLVVRGATRLHRGDEKPDPALPLFDRT